jgi:hypothetical protein
MAIEGRDLVFERSDPLGDGAQRELRGLGRRAQLAARGPEPPAERDLAAQRLAIRELVAELLRGGDDELAELHHRGAACFDRALARNA